MPTNNPDQIEDVYALHRGGDLTGTVQACQSILARDPTNFDALFLCGMAEMQLGHGDGALAMFERAMAIRPKNADLLNVYGSVLLDAGRIEDAISVCRDAAAVVLVNNEELINLGNALARAGRHEEALAQFDAALTTRPDLYIGHYNRGVALRALDRKEEAVLAFRRALTLKPDLAEAANNIGKIQESLGNNTQAMDAFREAVKAQPGYVHGWVNLGHLLAHTDKLDEGIECLSRAVEIDPNSAFAQFELGLGLMLASRPRDAVECFRKALTLEPNHNDAGFNLSLALLLLDELKSAWPLYDLRLTTLKRLGGSARVTVSRQSGDLSQKSDLAGDRLLVLGEQGLGDEIMFSSILPDILAIVPQTTLTADDRLIGLFTRSFPGLRVCGHPPQDGGLIAQVPVERRFFIGSLMRLFRERTEDFPGTPYLVADPARRAVMRNRLDALGQGPKIGLMWRGGVGGQREQLRSLALDDFSPLFKADGVHWVSLNHLTVADEEVAAFAQRTGTVIQHWGHVLRSNDYDDTAALLAELDAVVSVTGTVAHCAAALGVPTHVLVNRVPEWRYGNAGTTSPWYNAMTLYRQTDHWPIEELGRALGVLD